MMLVKWEKIPEEMRTEEVRKYYEILKKKKCSLFFTDSDELLNTARSFVYLSSDLWFRTRIRAHL